MPWSSLKSPKRSKATRAALKRTFSRLERSVCILWCSTTKMSTLSSFWSLMISQLIHWRKTARFWRSMCRWLRWWAMTSSLSKSSTTRSSRSQLRCVMSRLLVWHTLCAHRTRKLSNRSWITHKWARGSSACWLNLLISNWTAEWRTKSEDCGSSAQSFGERPNWHCLLLGASCHTHPYAWPNWLWTTISSSRDLERWSWSTWTTSWPLSPAVCHRLKSLKWMRFQGGSTLIGSFTSKLLVTS